MSEADRDVRERIGDLLLYAAQRLPITLSTGEPGDFTTDLENAGAAVRKALNLLSALQLRRAGEGEPLEMFLCEAKNVYLKLGQVYCFKVEDGCERCEDLAEASRVPQHPTNDD